MKLAEVLRPEHVVVPLPGGSLTENVRALFDGASMRRSGADEDRIRERLALLSTEDIVVLPDRAFIVHFRSDAVRSLLLMAGASASPICREAGDSEAQQCSQMLLLLIAPSRRAAEYLQMLGALGRFLSKQSVVEEILAHSDPASLESLLASLEFEVPEQLRVRDIMTARPRTTSGDTALRDAAKEMVRGSLGALIVVDQESRVVGMLGEKELMRDLLNNYLQGGTAHRDAPASTGRRRVKEVMTRQVLGVSPNQPLSEVASIMVNKDVERVPVVEDGKLVGALTRADIVRKIIGH